MHSVYLPSTLLQLKHGRQSAEQTVAIAITNEIPERPHMTSFILITAGRTVHACGQKGPRVEGRDHPTSLALKA